MSTRPLVLVSVLSATLLATPLWAGQGHGSGGGAHAGPGVGQGPGDCDPSLCLAAAPYQAVDETEEGHLVFMREEEKLARDLYLAFSEQWQWPQFANVAASEQQHMDAVKALLDKYAIADPIASDQPGVFVNQDLQQLYAELLAAGQASETEAFRVAALVEEVDIADLDDALLDTDNQDLTQLFSNLQRGSRNHLRAFAGAIEWMTGAAYEAQVLADERVAEILASGMERGGQGRGGEGAGGAGSGSGSGQGTGRGKG